MMKKSTRDAYGEALRDVGSRSDIVALDADLSVSTKTSLFAKRYPDRFFNVGCAEQNLVGVASGFALTGKIPFISTYAIFITRAWEQIRNTVAHDNLNVKIAVSHAGLTNAPDGASHQSLEDIAIMRAIPNIRVIVPADAVETERIVRSETTTPGPAYLRLNRAETPVLYNDEYEYQPGKAEILQDGEDIAIFATGTMVHKALEAAALLKQKQISATIMNVHTIKPLDVETVLSVAKACGRAVTVEEHSRIGGLGSAIAEVTAEGYPVPLRIIGTDDRFGESGQYEDLLERYGLTVKHIISASESLLR